jgi:hypothetical protein
MQGRSVTLVADLDVSGPHSSPNSRIVVRPPLAAGLAFLEVTCGSAYPLADLCTWLREHLVEPGHMTMPETVREPGLAPVSLGALGRASAGVADVRAARVVEVARGRVAATLSALLGRPADDRFLAGALYAGRVRRVTAVHDTRCVWRPSPRPEDRLSDMVLACFAADALDHRDEYDQRLCVCDLCGRVRFTPGATSRDRCAHHEGVAL